MEELPEARESVLGVQDTVRPIDGDTDSVRETLPAKPARLVTVIVEVALEPVWKPTVEGLAEIE